MKHQKRRSIRGNDSSHRTESGLLVAANGTRVVGRRIRLNPRHGWIGEDERYESSDHTRTQTLSQSLGVAQKLIYPPNTRVGLFFPPPVARAERHIGLRPSKGTSFK